MVTPRAAAIGEGEKFVSPGPFGGRDEEKRDFSAFVAADGSAQFIETGGARAFAGVVEPAFGGERGEFTCIRRWCHLSPPPHAPDFRFGGERQFNAPKFARC